MCYVTKLEIFLNFPKFVTNVTKCEVTWDTYMGIFHVTWLLGPPLYLFKFVTLHGVQGPPIYLFSNVTWLLGPPLYLFSNVTCYKLKYLGGAVTCYMLQNLHI